jgi:hypothetical protein
MHLLAAASLLVSGGVSRIFAGASSTPANNSEPAAMTGQKVMAELLLAGKADINARDRNGQTALHRAAAAGQKDLADWLRQHGGQE